MSAIYDESCKSCQYAAEGKWDGAAGTPHAADCTLNNARSNA